MIILSLNCKTSSCSFCSVLFRSLILFCWYADGTPVKNSIFKSKIDLHQHRVYKICTCLNPPNTGSDSHLISLYNFTPNSNSCRDRGCIENRVENLYTDVRVCRLSVLWIVIQKHVLLNVTLSYNPDQEFKYPHFM